MFDIGKGEGAVIAWVVIAGIIVAAAIVAIRIFLHVRWKFRDFAYADGFIVVSLAAYLLQGGLVLWEINEGLGSSIDGLSGGQVTNIEKALYADNILFVLAIWSAKTSTACLLFKLSDKSVYRIICGGCIFFMVFTMAINLAIVTLTCNLKAPWVILDHGIAICIDMVYRWQAVAIADLTTEVALMLVVLIMVYPIQISTHLKALVTLAFNQRVLVLIPIALRVYYLTKESESMDQPLPASRPVICKEVEIMYSIVAATIPCLPKFVTSKETYDVHYAPSKPAKGEEHLTRTQKVVLRTKSSLANLRSLTPLFGKQYPPKDDPHLIRFVPVDVYDLDNTAAVLDTVPPRVPPSFEFFGPELKKENHARFNFSINDMMIGQGEIPVPRKRRFTIENDDRTTEPHRSRHGSFDYIAVAL